MTIVTDSYTLTRGSAQRLDNEDAEKKRGAVFDDEKMFGKSIADMSYAAAHAEREAQ